MTMSATEKAPEGEATPAPASGLKKMLPILLVVLGGLIFGGASGVFMVGPMVAKKFAPTVAEAGKEAAKGEAAAKEGEGGKGGEGGGEAKVFLLDNMVLNPAGSSGQRFLLVSIALRLKDAAIETELKARDAEVRDAMLHVLGSKQVEELSDITKRDGLKEELRKTLDAIVKPGSIIGLYFPQFVIQ
jgi:flagellar basal body-associated protein FliL